MDGASRANMMYHSDLVGSLTPFPGLGYGTMADSPSPPDHRKDVAWIDAWNTLWAGSRRVPVWCTERIAKAVNMLSGVIMPRALKKLRATASCLPPSRDAATWLHNYSKGSLTRSLSVFLIPSQTVSTATARQRNAISRPALIRMSSLFQLARPSVQDNC